MVSHGRQWFRVNAMAESIDWSRIRAVYFDAVGTVLFPTESAPNIYCEAAKRYGLDDSPDQVKRRFTEAYFRQEAIDKESMWQTDEAREIGRWQAIVTESLPGTPPECFDWLYQHFAQPEAWRVPPEAVILFQELHSRGLQLGLASNYETLGRERRDQLRDWGSQTKPGLFCQSR
jgi:putative hydrolase of the HAD superfamily